MKSEHTVQSTQHFGPLWNKHFQIMFRLRSDWSSFQWKRDAEINKISSSSSLPVHCLNNLPSSLREAIPFWVSRSRIPSVHDHSKRAVTMVITFAWHIASAYNCQSRFGHKTQNDCWMWARWRLYHIQTEISRTGRILFIFMLRLKCLIYKLSCSVSKNSNERMKNN